MKFEKLKNIILPVGVIVLGFLGMLLGMKLPALIANYKDILLQQKNTKEEANIERVKKQVLPDGGFTLPISWGDFGPRLIKEGVIDENKFISATQATDEQKKILTKGGDVPITINFDNSQFVVDLLWAVGLAQKSEVYNIGPFGTDYKNEQDSFASTGGWTLAVGDPTKYLNKFDLIPLTPDQQNRVVEISKNVYRPCCDNPTWFPDCNHGMAALAAIEMMVYKNMSDEEIYQNVLKLNSIWFPDSYLSIAIYFDRQGVSWDKIDAKKVLGKEYSSATGAMNVSSQVGPLPGQSIGGSCGA